jgi:transposase
MSDHSEAFVAFDTSKLRNAVAIADGGRAGEVRFLGEFESSTAATSKLVRKLAAKYQRSRSATRPGPRVTSCIGISKCSGTSALWLRHR